MYIYGNKHYYYYIICFFWVSGLTDLGTINLGALVFEDPPVAFLDSPLVELDVEG